MVHLQVFVFLVAGGKDEVRVIAAGAEFVPRHHEEHQVGRLVEEVVQPSVLKRNSHLSIKPSMTR